MKSVSALDGMQGPTRAGADVLWACAHTPGEAPPSRRRLPDCASYAVAASRSAALRTPARFLWARS